LLVQGSAVIVAGIDPGKSGALFIYDPDCGCSTVYDVPTVKKKIAGRKNLRDVPDLKAWYEQWREALYFSGAEHVFIELVGGGGIQGRQQGGVSMFSFGYGAGFVNAIVRSCMMDPVLLTPQSWKKIVGLSGSDGEQSRARAGVLIPECVSLWPLKKHDGRAEAALIAWAGLQRVEGKQTDGRSPDGCGIDLPPPSSEAKGKQRKSRSRTKPKGASVLGKHRGSKASRPDGGKPNKRPARGSAKRSEAPQGADRGNPQA
jgi:hypothetical protein